MTTLDDLARPIAELREPKPTWNTKSIDNSRIDFLLSDGRSWSQLFVSGTGSNIAEPRPLDAALVLELLEEMPAARLEKHKDEGNEDIYWLCRPNSDSLMTYAPTKEQAIALAWIEWRYRTEM